MSLIEETWKRLYLTFTAHIDVKVSSNGRHRRTVDTKDHPQSYDLEFQINRSTVNLHLVQNNYIQTTVPTFVLKDESLIKEYIVDDEVWCKHYKSFKIWITWSHFYSVSVFLYKRSHWYLKKNIYKKNHWTLLVNKSCNSQFELELSAANYPLSDQNMAKDEMYENWNPTYIRTKLIAKH